MRLFPSGPGWSQALGVGSQQEEMPAGGGVRTPGHTHTRVPLGSPTHVIRADANQSSQEPLETGHDPILQMGTWVVAPPTEGRDLKPGSGVWCLWLFVETSRYWGRRFPVSPAHPEALCPTHVQHLRAYRAVSHPEVGVGWVDYPCSAEEETEGEGWLWVLLKVTRRLMAQPGLDPTSLTPGPLLWPRPPGALRRWSLSSAPPSC